MERLKAVAVALVDGHESFGLDTLGEAASLLAEAHAAAGGRLRALIAADIAATLLSRFQQGGGREVLDQAASLLAAEAEQPVLNDVVRSALDARLGGSWQAGTSRSVPRRTSTPRSRRWAVPGS